MTPSPPDSVTKLLDAYLPSLDAFESIDLETEDPLIISGFESELHLSSGLFVSPLRNYTNLEFFSSTSRTAANIKDSSEPRTIVRGLSYDSASLPTISAVGSLPDLIVHSDSSSDWERENGQNDLNNSSFQLSSRIITESNKNKYNRVQSKVKFSNCSSIYSQKRKSVTSGKRIAITTPRFNRNISKTSSTISSLYKEKKSPAHAWNKKIIQSITVNLPTSKDISNFKLSDSWSLFKIIREIEIKKPCIPDDKLMTDSINNLLLNSFYSDTVGTFKFSMPQFVQFISFTSNLFEITDPQGNTIILRCSGKNNSISCRAKLSLYYDNFTRSVYLTRESSWTHTHCHSPIRVTI